MATGRGNQLTKQLGEYLVACELARRGLLIATFSGNVPDLDLIATNSKGASIPIQVKTITKGHWQFSIDKFVKVQFKGKKQIIGAAIKSRIPHLMCVLVLAIEYGKDEFYILEFEQLSRIVVAEYRAYLARKGGVRPKKFRSLHCQARPCDLEKYRDKWTDITAKL